MKLVKHRARTKGKVEEGVVEEGSRRFRYLIAVFSYFVSALKEWH